MTQTYPIRCKIAAKDDGVTRVDVFDDIGGGDFWGGGLSAKDFAASMAKVKGTLEVHINSGGGDVFDGIAIGNAIRAHKGPVTTVVDGIAASIASVIAQAGQDRVMQPGSMLMIHDAFGLCVGNAAEMTKMAETLDQVSGNLAELYASRAGGTAEDWRDAMRQETWYTDKQAVAAGLADRVGDGEAELPAGMDLAAFSSVPGRIAARLRRMPQAKAPSTVIVDADGNHAPMTGSHAHAHPAYGSQGSDANHAHDHGHDGDANHNHSHAAADHGPRVAAGPCCSLCGPECACGGQPTAHGHGIAAADMHGDHQRFDPDGDGDCDACPEGDTDHDYWDTDGTQLQPVPGKPMDDELTGRLRDLIRQALRDAADGVDNSPWDASKAWSNGANSDDPAAFYNGICAGKKAGDPATQGAHALPYKYHPGDPPNAAGVKNALARLPQTEGLTNAAEAKKTLQAAMKKINPDYEPDDHAGTDLSGIDLEQLRNALKGALA